MSFLNKLSGGVAVVAMASAFGGAAVAQDTAAGVRGVIIGQDGSPVSGATVTLIHTPTNTPAQSTTGNNGSFFEGGLRVGGPYTATVTAPGFEPIVLDGLFFEPGSNNPLTLTLRPQDAVEQIIVRGTAVNAIDLNNGVGSSFTAADLANQPSFDRDLTDLLARDPLVIRNGEGQINVAGRNSRFNNLAIDGVRLTDDFGLSSSVYPTRRSPIALDTVEAVSVSVSEYDVTSGGYVGGLVNVLTRQGTNEFDGSIYYYYADEEFFGTRAFDSEVVTPDFTEEETGFTLRGPIIRDRLFFSVGYEEFRTANARDFTGGQNDFDSAFFDTFRPLINDLTGGVDVGTRPDQVATPDTTERTFGRLDWNINADHRAALTYSRVEEVSTSVSSNEFESAWHDNPQEINSYSLQLFSDWTDNFSTTLRIGYKDNERLQNCRANQEVGEVRLEFSEADLAGTQFEGLIDNGVAGDSTSDINFVAGCDRFRHANTFEDERLQVFASGDYAIGDHLITFGVDYENYDLVNLFASDTLGTFIFETPDQLLAGTPNRIDYRNVISNDRTSAAAAWGFNRTALFIQDEWQALPNLSLSAGLRYEFFTQDDEPPVRQDFIDAYGRTNQNNLDGIDLFMPRFGFRYEPFERTTIRGGFGLFSGGEPQVWISNAFQPQIFSVRDETQPTLTDLSVIPQNLVDEVAASNPNTPTFVDLIDPDFEIPSEWKASVQVEQEFDAIFGGLNLGENYLFTASLVYTRTNEAFRWTNVAQTELATTTPGVAPDGRPIYADLDALDIDNAIELTNTDEGESLIFATSLANDFDNGFGFYVNYAYQDVETVTPGTSSRAVSNFRAYVSSDRNNPASFTSPFETEHSFDLNFYWEGQILDADLTSRFDVFGTITSGQPFSYTFNTGSSNALFGRQGNGESPFDNDLLYVPAVSGGSFSDPNVVFAAGFDQAGFLEYIEDNGIATGGIVDRNSDESAWNQLWNLRFAQELPGIRGLERWVGDNNTEITVDVFNFLNLLDNDWGTQLTGQRFDTSAIVTADLVSAADVALNGVDGATALTGDLPRTTCLSATDCVYRFNSFRDRDNTFEDRSDSVWAIRVGLRYEF